MSLNENEVAIDCLRSYTGSHLTVNLLYIYFDTEAHMCIQLIVIEILV